MELKRRSISGSSGARLDCLHTVMDERKRSLLIALPFGVPATVAHAAFMKLAPHFNVATWESRYVLSTDQPFSGDEPLSPDEHVGDMLSVLRTLRVDRCCLIGYCSGAGIALLATRRHPEIFTTLILVNGEYQLFRKGHVSTAYQRSIDAFLPEVAVDRQAAHAMFSRMAELSRAGQPQSELLRQINLPFSHEERLFRYARNYMAYRDFDALSLARRLTLGTFVLSGGLDQHASTENSAAVARCIVGSRPFVDEDADHYEFCRPGSRTLAVIAAHLDESRADLSGFEPHPVQCHEQGMIHNE